MPILKPEDYDITYFDGKIVGKQHPAGYSYYKRSYETIKGIEVDSWEPIAKKYIDRFQLKDKKVLELGCAKGFILEHFRKNGVDAYGIDISKYSVGNADSYIKEYIKLGDVRDILLLYLDNFFDYVCSFQFIHCFPDDEIKNLIKEMNRISLSQFHVFDEETNCDFYIRRPMEEWISYDWKKEEILIDQKTGKETQKT